MQATLEAVDGSRLSSFFVQIFSLGDCSGGIILYAVVNAKMHLVLCWKYCFLSASSINTFCIGILYYHAVNIPSVSGR